jgi:hypothetical protein
MRIHVEQACHDLVNGVEGSPDTLSLAQSIEEFNWKCAQITALQCSLTFAKFGNNGTRGLLAIAAAPMKCRREIIPTAAMAPSQVRFGTWILYRRDPFDWEQKSILGSSWRSMRVVRPGDPDGNISGGVLYSGIVDPTTATLLVPPSIRNTAIQSPGFFPPTNITTTNADSKYNSLQAKVVKRMSHGLQVGAGKAYLSHGVAGKLFEGIQISGIVSAQTGHPYTIFTPLDNGRTGIASFSWPDVIGDPFGNPGARISADGVRTGAANAAAFTPASTFLGHLGDEGRNQFYGPSYTNADITLMKNVRFTERVRLQIRSEFFNILNHPQFSQPGNFIGENTLGLSTTTLTRSDGTTSARQIQLAMKLIF